jgi:deferrochelatase/peroxidase EfeB
MNTVAPGEIVLGYRDGLDFVPPSPESKGRDIGRNGTFLVVRQLEQDTAGFRRYVDEMAGKLACDPRDPRVPGCDRGELAAWIAAKMMGRWANGSSLVRNPHKPGSDADEPDNDFLYGREDPYGLRCPLGAHIRRANPRDSFDPGSPVQIEITNRHRILRVGRGYESGGKDGKGSGLLFMCINADIERQFEFLQQTWILDREFHGLEDEIDPVVAYRREGCAMTIPTAHGPLRLQGLAKFVTVRGGGYFFMPARSTLQMLAGGA